VETPTTKGVSADTLIPMVDERRILGLKVDIRLKGENSVAMGNAHRLVLEVAPSLKDLHKLRLLIFEC